MYLKGVSTRRVAEITEQLCGLDVTSAQVSRATAELDEQLAARFPGTKWQRCQFHLSAKRPGLRAETGDEAECRQRHPRHLQRS
jgi:transposase-like protein